MTGPEDRAPLPPGVLRFPDRGVPSGGDLAEEATITILERFETRDDVRRAWRRVPSRLPMRCRRLARIETDVAVETVDVSPGGVRLRCGGLITGDVVLCSLDSPSGSLGLKGLVVQTRPGPGGPPYVHVAWTNLSPADVDGLGRLLDAHEATGGDGPPAPGLRA